MLPPWDCEPAPYDCPRGTCPACGSGEVNHLILGMPADSSDSPQDPAWLLWAGCDHPGYNRVCRSCAATWTSY